MHEKFAVVRISGLALGEMRALLADQAQWAL